MRSVLETTQESTPSIKNNQIKRADKFHGYINRETAGTATRLLLTQFSVISLVLTTTLVTTYRPHLTTVTIFHPRLKHPFSQRRKDLS